MASLNVPSLQLLANALPDEVQRVLRSALSAQDKFNRDVAQAYSNLSAWVWTAPQLQGGWVPFASDRLVQYTQLSSGLVVLEGSVKSGTLGSTAFVLKQACWPDQLLSFPAWSSSETPARLLVTTAGDVIPQAGSTTEISLAVAFLPKGVSG